MVHWKVCSQVPCVGFSIGVERVLSILESKAKVTTNENQLHVLYFALFLLKSRLAVWAQ